MKDKKITKEEAIKELKESISTIMLTSDVVAFINRIETINVNIIKSDINNVINNYNPVDDISNVRFSIQEYNHIYIDSLDINLDRLKLEIREVLDRV